MKKNKIFDIVFIVSIIFLCIGLTIVPFQNDTFYTIKIGNLILNNGIDMKDHFSWITNLPYTYPHWLYDVFISILYKIGGFKLLHVSTILFYSIIGILIYIISKKQINNYFLASIITVILIGFLSPYITTRAQIISYIIFILEKYCIDEFLNSGNKKYAFFLFILSTILVNIHLGVWIFFFILFIPPIASHYITLIIKKISKRKKDFSIGRINFKSNCNTNKLFLIIILCLFTGLLTPLGLTPYTYIFKQFNSNAFSYIMEYSYITIGNVPTFFILLLILIGLFLLTEEKINLDDLFLFLGLSLMSLMAVRSFAYFIIICPFFINNYLKSLTNKISKKTNDKLHYIFTRKIELITIACCFIIFGIVYSFIAHQNNKFLPENRYPIAATNYIKDNLNTKEIKLFNEYSIGSYLLFNDIDVFIDSRQDLYSIFFNKNRDILKDYIDTYSNLNYEEVFDYYKITHIISNNDSILVKRLEKDSNYKKIYVDDYFSIYERIN